MKISFNLILDWLKEYSVEHHLPDTGRKFRRISLLPDDRAGLDPEYLYVCSPFEAVSAFEGAPDICFMCADDRDPLFEEIRRDAGAAGRYSGIITVGCRCESRKLFMDLEEQWFAVSEWNRQMQDMVIHDVGIQALITSSEPVIGNTIDVSDSAFTLLATTFGIETDHELSLLLRKYGYHPESTLQLMRQHDRFALYESAGDEPFVLTHRDFGPYDHVNRVFRFQNIYFTHAVMVCDHKPLTPGLMDLFEMLCSMLSIYIKREWDRRSSDSNSVESFILRITTKNLTDPNEIEKRAAFFHLPYNGKYELTAISTENDISVYRTRFIRELSELLPAARVFAHQDLFLILHPISSEGEQARDSFNEHLIRFLKRNLAVGGSSGIFKGLQMLPLAFRRASLALKYSPALCKGRPYIAPPSEPVPPLITSFSDCFARCIVGESFEGDVLWRNSRAGKALLTLYRHDLEHNNNNLPLLYAYLRSGMSASQTAALFHMHRNNVPYRINRICTIMDMDVTDENMRLDLFVSFIMFDIYGP